MNEEERDGPHYAAICIGLAFELALVALVAFVSVNLGLSLWLSIVTGLVMAVLFTHGLGIILKGKK